METPKAFNTVLTRAELAELFKKDPHTIDRWVRKLGLPCHKQPGTNRTFVWGEVFNWMKQTSQDDKKGFE